jgi:outer membrane protein assembly factor BamB
VGNAQHAVRLLYFSPLIRDNSRNAKSNFLGDLLMELKTKILLALSALFTAPALAADWPAFRGPHGDGISTDSSVPRTWSETENVKWRVDLPRPGNGSPIVSNGAIFVASAQDTDGRHRSLICLDRSDGGVRWTRTVEIDKTMPTHKTNPYCGSTPVADGQRVVVWHGSAGLYCYDFAGNELWSRDFGEFEHMWGYGTSPVLHGDLVFMHCAPGKRNFLTAVELETGNPLWEVEEPFSGTGNKRADGNYMGTWCTPVMTKFDGEDQLLCTMPTRLIAFEPSSGRKIWWCDGIRGPKGDLAYSSPIVAGDLCVTVGGFNGPSIGVRMGGAGKITEAQRVWRVEKNPQSIGTAVFVDGYLYRPNAEGVAIDCLDPRTGTARWKERATGIPHWGSIVYAGGHCYATDQDGATIVFRPSPEKLDVVSTNKLGDPTNATPAISDGEIFIRTNNYLFCIGS